MTEKKLQKLKERFEAVCADHIEAFCEKNKIDFDGWVGNEVGGIASFACQYFFHLNDIVFDLHTNQPAGLILDWQSDGVEAHFKNQDAHSINYRSYSSGLRFEK